MGRVHEVVFQIGIFTMTPPAKIDLDDFNRLIDTN